MRGGSGSRIDDAGFEQDSIKSSRASTYVFLPVGSATFLWFREMDYS